MTPEGKNSTTAAGTAAFGLDGETAMALDCELLLGASGPMPMEGITYSSFASLTPEVLALVKPTRILMPLFAAGYDAMTAIEVLEDMGYQGLITVIAPALPRPRLVEKELRGLGPGMRLNLVTP